MLAKKKLTILITDRIVFVQERAIYNESVDGLVQPNHVVLRDNK
jgi:hypothetical protein